MDTKILWLSDTQYDKFAPRKEEQDFIFANMLEFAQGIARPTTQFVINVIDQNIGQDFAPYHKYNRVLMAVEILERVKQAEQDGFDAGFPGMCYGEFFLQEARQAVRMPVVGPAESAMTIAQLIGEKFGVVTVSFNLKRVMDENIRLHGWESRAIANQPVRAWLPDLPTLMVDAYNGRPDRMVEEFDKVAMESVRDGADVVICGCNPLGAALSQVGYNEVGNTGVPVVTPLPAMIKLAESMVDLRRSLGLAKTEAVNGPYRSTPDNVLADLAARSIGLSQVRKPGQALAEAYAPSGPSVN